MAKTRILILAPFALDSWIDDFCHRTDYEFKKALYLEPPRSWHERGSTTSLTEWASYLRYTFGAMKWEADCIITCFPQLALTTAALLRYRNSKCRLIAWTFNVGSISSGWKGYLAGKVLRRVDQFVVHSKGEIGGYARWLDIDESRFNFVPLQKGKIAGIKSSPIDGPYIVSMGSANRDYNTLVEAVRGTGIKTVVISKPDILDTLPVEPNLIKLYGLSEDECNTIANSAAMNVVPIAAGETASGQVTFTTSMRLGVATIATRCVGTIDYISSGTTGLLVSPGNPLELRNAINSLWRDKGLRQQIASTGREYADRYFSDEAAGRYLEQVIDQVMSSYRDDMAS